MADQQNIELDNGMILKEANRIYDELLEKNSEFQSAMNIKTIDGAFDIARDYIKKNYSESKFEQIEQNLYENINAGIN